MQGAEPVLTRRKPPSNKDDSDSASSSEEPAPQIVNKRVNPARAPDQPSDNTSLILLIIVALLASATLFTYLYMNLKQAGIIRDVYTRKQKEFLNNY